jgi:hypothetical protein
MSPRTLAALGVVVVAAGIGGGFVAASGSGAAAAIARVRLIRAPGRGAAVAACFATRHLAGGVAVLAVAVISFARIGGAFGASIGVDERERDAARQ